MAVDALALCCGYGFSLIPLGDGGTARAKKPRFSWAAYQRTAADEDQVASWAALWPQANWGIVCGLVSNCLVVDCDSAKAIAWAQAHLCATPMTVQTRRGRHLYYRHPGKGSLEALRALRRRWKAEGLGVDLQMDGYYVVAPGSLHEDGVTVYTLHEAVSGVWDMVPELALAEGTGDLAFPTGTAVAAAFGPTPVGGRHDAMVAHAGRCLARGLQRDAVLADTREQNRLQCLPPLPDREIVAMVDSLCRTHARKHGTAPTEGAEPSEEDAPVPPASPESSLPAGMRLRDIPDSAFTWPVAVLHPGGLLEQIVDYTLASNVRTERIFALAGAIALLGGVLGMRIQTETGLTSNIYCMAIGNSSAGKDAPRKSIAQILYAPGSSATLANLNGGSDVASDTAILNYLCRPGCQRALFCLDEIGLFLKSTKVPTSSRAGVIKLLTELYSGNGAMPYVKRYANSENDKTVPWRALSLLGMSVPGEFWSAVSDGEAVNGFLARCLIFEHDEAAAKPRCGPLDRDVPPGIVAGLNALWALDAGEDEPEYTGRGGVALSFRPRPRTVTLHAAARAFHEARRDAQFQQQLAAERCGDMAAASLHGRAGENALKLALVRWGSDFQGDTARPITEEQMRWAWLVMETCLARTLEQIQWHIHSTDFEAWSQDIVLTIRKYVQEKRRKGDTIPGAPRRILERALRGVPSRTVEEVLFKLLRQRILAEVPWKPKRGPSTTIFCLVEDEETL